MAGKINTSVHLTSLHNLVFTCRHPGRDKAGFSFSGNKLVCKSFHQKTGLRQGSLKTGLRHGSLKNNRFSKGFTENRFSRWRPLKPVFQDVGLKTGFKDGGL